MKIVIVHSRTKRSISGNFELIGSLEDLLSIGEQILADCKNRSWAYGGVHIKDTSECILPDQEPIGWDE